MEYLEGDSLAAVIRREGKLEAEIAVSIVRESLNGLESAHRRGIVHRDLKPENIFIHSPEFGAPVVKLMDFGVCQDPVDGNGREDP